MDKDIRDGAEDDSSTSLAKNVVIWGEEPVLADPVLLASSPLVFP